MARMIPKVISDSASLAEKKVFYTLEKLDDNYIVFHSLNLPDHLDKIKGEIDFVVICKYGILSLEVKGGSVERTDGMWKFTDREGNSNLKSEGPYEQVEGNMYSLMKYLKDKLGEQNNIVKTQFANAVVFTDIENFSLDDIEFKKEITIDKNRLEQNDIEKIIKEVFKYYAERTYEVYKFYRRELSKNELEKLTRFFREDFGYVYSLNQELNEIEKQIVELTEKQKEAFREMEDNDRIILKGNGGTGKTLILYEEAVRKSIEGKKVLFLCFNDPLFKFLNNKLQSENDEIKKNIEIYQIHSCLIKKLKEVGINIEVREEKDFFEEELPKTFLKYEHERADVLIVDEAQDILNYNYVDTLDKLLDKGLKDGNWYMALDQEQNLYNLQFEEVYEYIKIEIRPTIKKLNENCRNTKQISYQNELLTEIVQTKNETINGKEVRSIKYSNNDEQKMKIKEIIRELKSNGIALDKIVILSKYKFENSVFKGENFLKDICKLKFINEFINGEGEGVTFSTIHKFKGLEAPIIILCDIEDLNKRSNQVLNYVAMSRSKELLYVLLSENAYKQYEEHVMNKVMQI